MVDIGIYNKLISKKNFTEDYIPTFFVGKFYILKYLFENEYFVDENIQEPTKYIFKIYRELYDFVTNEFKLNENNNEELNEELNELKNDFKLSLPDKKITTDRQIFDTLNKKSNDVDLFVEPTGYSDNESESELESESTSHKTNDDFDTFDDEMNKLIINKIRDNIIIYKDITKNNKDINENFEKEHKIIEYMYNEGFFDDTDIQDSINDYYNLYCLLLDFLNNKKIDDEILIIFTDELENFKKYMWKP